MFFRNEYWFLSNMYPCEIRVNGLVFTCAEACFQSFKTTDINERKKFQGIDGFKAKKLGRSVSLRSDWNDIRIEVMSRVIHAKFHQNPDLTKKLQDTGDLLIIEDNTWKDTFWGVCNGKGHNLLGQILMNERDRINSQDL